MDLYNLLLYKAVGGNSGGGGEGGVKTQALTVTANGTYTAPTGRAYTPVKVEIPSAMGASIPLGSEVTE